MKFMKSLHKIMNKNMRGDPLKDPFPALTYLEKQAVEVFDYRNLVSGNPNNKVMITCEHASNNTHGYIFPSNEKKWLDTHWGYDIGAKDIGMELSEAAEILSIHSNFSRLLIDPNRSLISNSLIRQTVEKGEELTLNRDDRVDRDKRIEIFYLPYYRLLFECLSYIKPKYVISSHSFTKQYEDSAERNFEVGILYRDKGLLADMIESAYKREGVEYRVNEPYHPKEGVCHAMDNIQTYNWPESQTDVVLMEFRNDHCSDSKWRKKQISILKPIIDQLAKH
jgi:predicted N-formylglutamate amidohydrolase